MKRIAGIVVVIAAVGGVNVNVHADDQVKSSYQPCVACHGASGEGNAALNAPALAGQDAAYLQRQLQHFKAGRRGASPDDVPGAQMRAMAATLADASIPALAAYLSSLPVTSVVEAVEGDLRNGSNYYQASCGACHGGKAEGNAGLNSPNLVMLDATYLKRQFQHFQQGLRGSDPQDRFGTQMKMMSTTLPGEKDLDDVIAFIRSLAAQ